MRRIASLVLALSAISLLGDGSQAADLPTKARPIAPPPAYSWTGFYVGGNVGGWGNSRHVDFAGNDESAQTLLLLTGQFNLPPGSFNTVGAFGGVQAGYNWQFRGNWLLGLEADFEWSGIRGSGTVAGTGILIPTASFEERVKWFGTVRARLGFLPADNFLAYVTGGFAYGRVERGATLNSHSPDTAVSVNDGFGLLCGNTVPTCFAGSSSETATGWTVGAGFEYGVSRNWSVKAEYLYVSLDAGAVTATALNAFGSPAPATVNVDFGRTDFHVARAGMNFRF